VGSPHCPADASTHPTPFEVILQTDNDHGNKGEVRPLANKDRKLEDKMEEGKTEDLIAETGKEESHDKAHPLSTVSHAGTSCDYIDEVSKHNHYYF
jgi:hypothetical protein